MSKQRTFAFTKMEGLGNDYVYAEEFTAPLKYASEMAKAISDRHFGVGGDGLVLMGPSNKADFRMRMFNSDGSEAEMCGNATRCVGKYLYEKGKTDKTTFTLETLAGIRTLELTVQAGVVTTVRVDMGEPILDPKKIPMTYSGDQFIGQDISAAGISGKGTAVSMGNPHVVIPMKNIAELDLPAIGPAFEHHPLFPRRTNTEFIEVISKDYIKMRVWERGAGETLACGTGACAVLVACVLNGFTDRKATIELLGGKLEIHWAENNTVFMSGSARFVFSGDYIIPDSVPAE